MNTVKEAQARIKELQRLVLPQAWTNCYKEGKTRKEQDAILKEICALSEWISQELAECS